LRTLPGTLATEEIFTSHAYKSLSLNVCLHGVLSETDSQLAYGCEMFKY